MANLILEVNVVEIDGGVCKYLGSAQESIKYTNVDIDGLPRKAVDALYDAGILDLRQALFDLEPVHRSEQEIELLSTP